MFTLLYNLLRISYIFYITITLTWRYIFKFLIYIVIILPWKVASTLYFRGYTKKYKKSIDNTQLQFQITHQESLPCGLATGVVFSLAQSGY
jgi:cytochrome c biogenesis protein CcdA